jgi:mannose-6-phosphate isomerase
MRKIAYLDNPIQRYPWGSATALPNLLGTTNPEGTPQAELWMGAHPKSPSLVQNHSGWVRLDELIRRYPVEILGRRVFATYGPMLPFLFKVLAAAEPLSIQAHPDLPLAEEGFERENRQGIPLDAPERNYRDAHHKPECICALTPFWALYGFRPPAQILKLLRVLCPSELAGELSAFAGQCDVFGLRHFFIGLLRMKQTRRQVVIAEALSNLPAAEDETLAWIAKLAHYYPEDIAVLAPALLNVCRLSPGQALYLPAGVLHSYLGGMGIEIMANSDNVVRCGLTPKPIDVAELLRVLRFDFPDIRMVYPFRRTPHEKVYRTPAKEFQLSAIRLRQGEVYQSWAERSVEILLCSDGRARIAEMALDGCQLEMKRGTSVLVPAAAGPYRIVGEAELFRATLPEDIA